jgi:hypothetical protein
LPETTEPFPMNITLSDGLLISLLVGGLSTIFAYLTVLFLVKNNFSKHLFVKSLE